MPTADTAITHLLVQDGCGCLPQQQRLGHEPMRLTQQLIKGGAVHLGRGRETPQHPTFCQYHGNMAVQICRHFASADSIMLILAMLWKTCPYRKCGQKGV
jgi:hypothetical protein